MKNLNPMGLLELSLVEQRTIQGGRERVSFDHEGYTYTYEFNDDGSLHSYTVMRCESMVYLE